MAHINTSIPETLIPLQLAYCSNRSTDDAVSIAFHTALSHLDKRKTYVRMLFIDYSSVFNTIVPTKLITMLRTLGLNLPLQLDPVLPDGSPPGGKGRQHTSAMLILNTGAPQVCVLSPQSETMTNTCL